MHIDAVFPYGEAQITALLKAAPDDFQVEEVLGFDPDGQGEHLFLWVEKRGRGTHELIEKIARDHGLSSRAISHSGLKDKHALTRQWLSVHLPGQADPFDLPEGDGYRVLRQLRNSRKLRPGSHRANRFQIRLRDVETLPDETRAQLIRIGQEGFANYFGDQRFGRNADNVDQALAQLGNRRLSRSRRSLLISSLRSYLFNAILAQRVSDGHWSQPLDGDVFMLRGTHSIFSQAVDDSLRQRFDTLDVSSCGSLHGSGSSLMSAAALALEATVLARYPEILTCLEKVGARLQMRALRVAAEDFDYRHDAANATLEIVVTLPAGSYVTSLLEHFVVLQEPDQASRRNTQNQPSGSPSRK